ncbi:MAG: hypothetical protein AB3N14_19075 [Flavobacteriaceae bacterium]
MKKVLSVLAVAVLSIGLFSCEPETSVAETDALYDTIDIDASDDDEVTQGGSGGNN